MAKKKVITLFTATAMAALMTISMAACGDPTVDPNKDPNKDPAGKDPVVTEIEVTTAPTKTHYVLGETFDTTGMVISKVYDNNTTEEIPSTEYTFSPSGALKTSDKKVTISWDKFDVDQKISVTNDIASVTIVTQPTKQSYITGELFDPTGMTIKAVLENGDEEDAIPVTADVVEYNTQKLTAGDSHFKMTYGGFEFYYDMTVKCGAFMEAEAGIPMSSGVQVGAAPNQVAIEADLNNLAGRTGDGEPMVRGIDKGLVGKDPNGNDYTITESRVDVRNYIFDPAVADKYTYLDFCATGGGNVASLAPEKNIMEFDRSGNGSIMYALRADKTGKVNLTFRMSVSDPDSSAVAPETLLSDVLEITVNGTKVTIPATSKLNNIDFSALKSYTPSTTELSTLGNIKGTFEGKTPRTKYYWQDVTVPISMIGGDNKIVIKSLITNKRDMVIDSVSFDGDEDKVSLFNECVFAPEIMDAKLKVENEKVYMGLTVDTKSVGYSNEDILTILGLTSVKSTGCSTYNDNLNINGSTGKNDPWTTPTGDGGLGYTTEPRLKTSGKGGDWKSEINKREVSVEKITDGDSNTLYCVWLEVTTPDDAKGQSPDTNRFVGALYFSGFSYGRDYANIHPPKDILKSDDSTCVESGGYCYQVFCDARDRYACFYAGNEINLMLIVQDGTFDDTKASNTLPLRNKLMRRYTTNMADNDQELIDIHKPTEPAA